MSSTADFTPQARIRHAALELFGRNGFEKTTIRAVAALAGVSPALVMHHYGSKENLRQACDDWMFTFLESEKRIVATGGSLPELQAYLAAHPEVGPIMDYITATLRAGGPAAHRLFERMCDLTRNLLVLGEQSGTMRYGSDLEATVATLVAYSTGAVLMGDALAQHLGGRHLMDPDVYAHYARASVELFTDGMFTSRDYLTAMEASSADAPIPSKESS